LAEVGTHSALAVESVRQHEAAVAQAREEGAAEVLKAAQQFLAPGSWPETPGFESAPLRWRSDELNLVSFAVAASAGRIAFLLIESALPPSAAFGSLIRAGNVGRGLLATAEPAKVVEKTWSAEPGCSVAAALWEGERVRLAAAGDAASVPFLLREGRPVPFPVAENQRIRTAQIDAAAKDLLLLASTGLDSLQFTAKPIPSEKVVQQFARSAQGHPLSGAFAQMVSEWKRAGTSPGQRDVLLLAARRQ
jgi:hypothetical protein